MNWKTIAIISMIMIMIMWGLSILNLIELKTMYSVHILILLLSMLVLHLQLHSIYHAHKKKNGYYKVLDFCLVYHFIIFLPTTIFIVDIDKDIGVRAGLYSHLISIFFKINLREYYHVFKKKINLREY